MGWRDGYIAVDWGTTNRRAYRLDGDGEQVDEFDDGLGITSIAAGGFAEAAATIRSRLGDLPMLLAGMVGSNRGWREAPYRASPAGLADLARAILWIEPSRTGIVPGISQQGAAGADVMRGEEVQALGAIAAGLAPGTGLLCLPGTHAKWVVTQAGAIAAFRTMMTGELFALLKQHSILAAQLEGEVGAGAAFDEGLSKGMASSEFLADLFNIRARRLMGESGGDDASYASGLLIGSDVRAGVKLGDGPVTLIGRPDLCGLYALALAKAGRDSVTVDGSAAFVAGMRRLVETVG